MKMLRRLGVALLLAATAQGCATVGGKKIAAKKPVIKKVASKKPAGKKVTSKGKP